LLDRFGGDLAKAVAAYNGGEEAVAKWERRAPGAPTDEFVETISYRETRNYVRRISYRYHRGKTPVASVPGNISTAGGI